MCCLDFWNVFLFYDDIVKNWKLLKFIGYLWMAAAFLKTKNLGLCICFTNYLIKVSTFSVFVVYHFSKLGPF